MELECKPASAPLKERTKAVKAEAARLKFDACAVAEATGTIDPDDRLGDWLARGFHAGMDWMARTREVRRDADRKLPGVQSVVVVARNYFARRPRALPGSGRISRYAWGRDYHRVLIKPLRRLAAFVEQHCPGCATYCSVDSGPVMEKLWAARAGLGWIGKNSLVLRRDLGSWFFLGTILTTAELEPDAPVADQCGSCTLCLEACPTSALVAPRVVDSNRCVSYHTIENRGEVPVELAKRFGDWIFGCDVCQEVCPWNRRVGETSERDFLPRGDHANPSLERVLSISEGEFRREFVGTPILRAKYAGFMRNARIARENVGGEGGE